MGESLSNLLEGFSLALTPMNLLWVTVGCILGTAVGFYLDSVRRWP